MLGLITAFATVALARRASAEKPAPDTAAWQSPPSYDGIVGLL